MFLSKIFTFCDFKRQKPDWLFKKAHSPALTATDGTLSPLVWTGHPASRPTVWERTTNHWKNCPICPAHVIISQWGYQQTCGGVGVEVVLPPDIISSVMSRPPWLGSRILICEETTGKSQASGSKQKHTKCCSRPPVCALSVWLVLTAAAELAVEAEPVAAERDSSWQAWRGLTLGTAVSQGNRQPLDHKKRHE